MSQCRHCKEGICSEQLKFQLLGAHRHPVGRKTSVDICSEATVYLKLHLLCSLLIQKKKKKEQGKRNEEAYCLFSMLKAQTVHAVRLQRWWVQPLEEKLWFKGSKMSTPTVRPLSLLTIFFGCKSIPFLDTLWPTVIKYMCLYTNWTTKFFLHLSWNLPAMK